MPKSDTKIEKKPEFGDVMQMAIEVADRVELEGVRLVGSKCELMSFPGTKKNKFETTATTEFDLNPENSMLFVLVHFGLDAVDEEDRPLAKTQADLLLMYHIKDFEDLTDDHLKHFADKNGVFNAWPYWREFVQNMTTRMQLPPLTLPTYRFGRPLPEKSTITGAKKAILATTKKTAKKKSRKKTAKKSSKK